MFATMNADRQQAASWAAQVHGEAGHFIFEGSMVVPAKLETQL